MSSADTINRIINNVEKVIVGKRQAVSLMLVALMCDGHALVEDVPGVGKTSMVSAMARSISASFKRIQFTPDILPSDITGFSMFNAKTQDFDYRPGAIMSNIILADEINRTSPKTQASLLEVMEENHVTVDGITYNVPKPFMVMATQNPVEYLGTFPLPEAQLDRFFLKISMGYPEVNSEVQILKNFRLSNPIDTLAPVATSEDIIAIQNDVKNIFVSDELARYIVDIVSATRTNPNVTLGSSPRGSLCLFRAAQAIALMNGRNFVTPDDIKSIVSPVLSHRIILRHDAKLKRVDVQDILDNILQTVKVPSPK